MKSYCPTYFTAALVSLLLLVPLPASATTEVPSPIEVRFHEFSNGMGLYHVKVDEATNFKLSVTVWVGSVDEDPEVNGGVSHLLEHILFHQPDMSETEFKAQVESQGGSFNGKTAEDYTQYYVNLPARHLDLGQNWFYRVLVHDRLVTDRLEEEKEIVNRENEWSTPTWLDQLWKLIEPEYLELPGFWERNFGLHEYGQPVEGTYKVGSKLTAAQLEAHYRKYYYTENMVLLYVGPHELDEVIASLAPTFGSVPATGMKTNLHPLIENQSPRPYFSHDLTNSQYNIGIGHVFTGLRFSKHAELFLYRFVLGELLEERFRYGEGKAYSVSYGFDNYRGAGYVQFNLEASPETYWKQLADVKEIVWGELGAHLSREDYERFKATLSEQLASMREIDSVHGWIWGAIHRHPLHRPSPEEADILGPWMSVSYEGFLDLVRIWRYRTAPLLELSMPVIPFPYTHLLLLVFAVGIGAYLSRFLLRHPFPRENIKLMTRVPYGIPGWIQLGLFYAVAAFVVFHLDSVISYGMLFFSRVNALAMLDPYIGRTFDGLLIGIAVVMGGLVMPRKVLATDGALVLKMRSPLFFRIPLEDIKGIEPVHGWAAWKRILSLKALPVYPWFVRGLLIHRKSGRSLVLHTEDDQGLFELLSSQADIDVAISMATAESPSESEALITN